MFNQLSLKVQDTTRLIFSQRVSTENYLTDTYETDFFYSVSRVDGRSTVSSPSEFGYWLPEMETLIVVGDRDWWALQMPLMASAQIDGSEAITTPCTSA